MKIFLIILIAVHSIEASASCDDEVHSGLWKSESVEYLYDCASEARSTTAKSNYFIELAKKKYSLGLFKEVELILLNAKKELPFNLNLSLALIDFYLIQESFDLAEDAFSIAKALHFNDPKFQVYDLKFQLLKDKQNNSNPSIKVAESIPALEKKPKLLKAYVENLIAKNEISMATEILNKISLSSGKKMLSFKSVSLGKIAILKNDLISAEKSFKLALEHDSSNSSAEVALFKLLVQQKKDKAELYSFVKERCAIESCSVELTFALVKFYLSEKKIEEADLLLKRFTEGGHLDERADYYKAIIIKEREGTESLANYLEPLSDKYSWAKLASAKLYFLAGSVDKAENLIGSDQVKELAKAKESIESDLVKLEKPNAEKIVQTKKGSILNKNADEKKNLDYVIVRSGDTLPKLAKKYLGSRKKWKQLADNNGINNSKDLKVGNKIYLTQKQRSIANEKQFSKTTVKKGESLAEVSYRLFGTHKLWKKLLEWNKELISDPDHLKVGMKIKYIDREGEAD
ncbi:MAG: LysM peptidoglycan-binding domain-containing protein [Oligoflexia bacterium]|nr:LysM peptidoglycan-binding domain-containing protein [Oligoflexia bacterium]